MDAAGAPLVPSPTQPSSRKQLGTASEIKSTEVKKVKEIMVIKEEEAMQQRAVRN